MTLTTEVTIYGWLLAIVKISIPTRYRRPVSETEAPHHSSKTNEHLVSHSLREGQAEHLSHLSENALKQMQKADSMNTYGTGCQELVILDSCITVWSQNIGTIQQGNKPFYPLSPS